MPAKPSASSEHPTVTGIITFKLLEPPSVFCGSISLAKDPVSMVVTAPAGFVAWSAVTPSPASLLELEPAGVACSPLSTTYCGSVTPVALPSSAAGATGVSCDISPAPAMMTSLLETNSSNSKSHSFPIISVRHSMADDTSISGPQQASRVPVEVAAPIAPKIYFFKPFTENAR